MKVKDLRLQTNGELVDAIGSLKGELFNLRFQLATGQCENPMRVREVRKAIARAKTILRERELGIG
ncbi:MAG: 50S ribosomal protein L29 [Acidibacillus sp.]|uniref:Large ribosomal subunit protein uL29 n=1 Tax=Sulfoacidibacillus ferrooxidans TaxID=2005001 RepID=A0A9X1V9P3_9BACL|nr:50S ribosomal protein L29 [Sulfoacidibacillus ferrooxidans]MCI0183839.1 50S ribosomal protein L29 [Sulfoacidibacillus ferrooxidans]MCY0893700.1 50S ribosomal protein L29 [Acidibacillus sp.]